MPAGCPLALLPLLVLIEFISYLARNVSLGLRLAANVKKRLGTSFLLRLRTKLRGNPKALITKDKTETSYLASLIIEGIVTLLEILAIVMGNRGSKSVIL